MIHSSSPSNYGNFSHPRPPAYGHDHKLPRLPPDSPSSPERKDRERKQEIRRLKDLLLNDLRDTEIVFRSYCKLLIEQLPENQEICKILDAHIKLFTTYDIEAVICWANMCSEVYSPYIMNFKLSGNENMDWLLKRPFMRVRYFVKLFKKLTFLVDDHRLKHAFEESHKVMLVARDRVTSQKAGISTNGAEKFQSPSDIPTVQDDTLAEHSFSNKMHGEPNTHVTRSVQPSNDASSLSHLTNVFNLTQDSPWLTEFPSVLETNSMCVEPERFPPPPSLSALADEDDSILKHMHQSISSRVPKAEDETDVLKMDRRLEVNASPDLQEPSVRGNIAQSRLSRSPARKRTSAPRLPMLEFTQSPLDIGISDVRTYKGDLDVRGTSPPRRKLVFANEQPSDKASATQLKRSSWRSGAVKRFSGNSLPHEQSQKLPLLPSDLTTNLSSAGRSEDDANAGMSGARTSVPIPGAWVPEKAESDDISPSDPPKNDHENSEVKHPVDYEGPEAGVLSARQGSSWQEEDNTGNWTLSDKTSSTFITTIPIDAVEAASISSESSSKHGTLDECPILPARVCSPQSASRGSSPIRRPSSPLKNEYTPTRIEEKSQLDLQCNNLQPDFHRDDGEDQSGRRNDKLDSLCHPHSPNRAGLAPDALPRGRKITWSNGVRDSAVSSESRSVSSPCSMQWDDSRASRMTSPQFERKLQSVLRMQTQIFSWNESAWEKICESAMTTLGLNGVVQGCTRDTLLISGSVQPNSPLRRGTAVDVSIGLDTENGRETYMFRCKTKPEAETLYQAMMSLKMGPPKIGYATSQASSESSLGSVVVAEQILEDFRVKAFLRAANEKWDQLGTVKLSVSLVDANGGKRIRMKSEKDKSLVVDRIVGTNCFERLGRTGVAVSIMSETKSAVYLVQVWKR